MSVYISCIITMIRYYYYKIGTNKHIQIITPNTKNPIVHTHQTHTYTQIN